MSYIARSGRIWSMPYGGEYVGESSEGIPLYFNGTGLCQMKLINPRRLGRPEEV